MLQIANEFKTFKDIVNASFKSDWLSSERHTMNDDCGLTPACYDAKQIGGQVLGRNEVSEHSC